MEVFLGLIRKCYSMASPRSFFETFFKKYFDKLLMLSFNVYQSSDRIIEKGKFYICSWICKDMRIKPIYSQSHGKRDLHSRMLFKILWRSNLDFNLKALLESLSTKTTKKEMGKQMRRRLIIRMKKRKKNKSLVSSVHSNNMTSLKKRSLAKQQGFLRGKTVPCLFLLSSSILKYLSKFYLLY